MNAPLKLVWIASCVLFALALVACPRHAPPKGKPVEASWSGSPPRTSKNTTNGKPIHRFPKVGKFQLIDAETPGTGTLHPELVVVQFSDYECPFCGLSHSRLEKAAKKYANKMRIYHRHFPLDHHCNRILKKPYHETACEAAKGAVCAKRQGRFWEMHDALFRNPRSHQGKALEALAQKSGLDLAKFQNCMKDPKTLERVKKDIELSLAVGVDGTPTYVFFGPKVEITKVGGLLPEDAFDQIFEKLKKR